MASYKTQACPLQKMQWDDVVRAFMTDDWRLHNGKREKYIGACGAFTVLPGVPRDWYLRLIPCVKRAVVTCEYGLDWWSEEQRFRVNDSVVHRVKFTMDTLFYEHVQANWELISNRRL